MRPADNTHKLFKKLRLRASAQLDDRVRSDIARALEKSRQTKRAPTRPNVWRIMMSSKIRKLTAAAIVLAAIGMFFMFMEKTMTRAYAIEQTIEACNSIRWLHIEVSEMIYPETRTTEFWLACDEQGNVTRMRLQSDNVGEPVGSGLIAGDSDSSEVWLARHNLHLVGYGDPGVLLNYDISELDPKFLFERLFEQESRHEAIVDVNEPMEKTEPVIVTVTYPQGTRSEKWKKVFYIDQATKLVTRIDKFEWRSQGFQHIKTLEFCDYNQQIDPMMFTLDGDVPDDARVVDMTEVEAGLSQGDMTDEEVAEKVTTEFFKAVIARDFYKAGQLYLRAPDFLIEQAFMGVNVHKIISVGPGHRDPDPDSNAIHCSCKVLAEIGGQYYELNAWMVRVIRIDKDTNRWLICGIATGTRPAPGIMTLSGDGADLSAVTYDRLKPGEFMLKWLLLEPIRIEGKGDTAIPSEKIQRDEFATDQIDVSNFQAKVNVSGEEHEWWVLENEYGIIDLTGEFGEWSLITYAWAQIEMSEERQVVLGIGSDDGVKVWLNGELVHENWVCRGVCVDNDRVSVTFKKGTNQLVLKVQNHGGPWGFCCRLLDE
ncbi:MAG TPA: hypothetical protein VMX13_02890 [Sedimentisphaerales bacterium]|nr:hypothetical protein [Sedimentisphaerales bacterium]